MRREFKGGLPYLVTFMQEYRPATTGVMLGHAWSLGIEEKFYLAWPLLIVALFPFRRRTVALTLVLGIGILFLPPQLARSYGGLLLGALLGIVLRAKSWQRFPAWFVDARSDHCCGIAGGGGVWGDGGVSAAGAVLFGLR